MIIAETPFIFIVILAQEVYKKVWLELRRALFLIIILSQEV